MSAATIPPFEATPITSDGMRALGVQWPVFEKMIKRIAHTITKDPDDRKDLIQSAMVEFWEIDPTRNDLTSHHEIAYVRTRLVHRMWDVWGKDQGGEQAVAMGLLIPVVEE